MRDFANDLAHIVFVMVVLGLPAFWWWGCIPAALLIGLLVELKEEDSNILNAILSSVVSPRDVMGYVIGGVIISGITFFVK